MLARLAALLQHALDDTAGNLHAEPGHRGAIGQREDVRRLQRFIERVDERLPDGHARQQAVDPAAHVHHLQGQMAFGRSQNTEARLVVGSRRGETTRDQLVVQDQRQRSTHRVSPSSRR